VNVAVTFLAPPITTVHCAPAVESHPAQLVNVEPWEAEATSVTVVPDRYEARHVAPQAMPAGDDVTVPDPVPPLVTVSP
jgi:hypothetical protein